MNVYNSSICFVQKSGIGFAIAVGRSEAIFPYPHGCCCAEDVLILKNAQDPSDYNEGKPGVVGSR